MKRCPCGSDKAYRDCCAPLHHGAALAASAEALMRSRYCAYVLKLGDYLSATWHPSSRPQGLDISHDETPWQRLQIIDTVAGSENDDEGVVEFAAYFAGGQLHERSRFVKEGGQWFYVDGELLPPVAAAKVGRNEWLE
ncbi:MAG: YchJ family metal-binding protein [Gammaproteobacteria bacterium]|nr:YchJ family metal-binding protein [Gammaproteobacteria bacterium]MCW8971859.1 YchJ family metal-binding protein [Gammaproteobacteria bacterium]MCW8994138.1 YchJ family metal-binding protein [Gammaproteobacteria bacterium]